MAASAHNNRNRSPKQQLYRQKKEGETEIDGKIVVDIEICQNCKEHQWCTRHDESKYKQMFEEIRSAILAENPNVVVTQNNFVKIPTLGAFEITCMRALLYSKNRSGCFPHATVVANLIKNFLTDKENGRPTNQYDLNLIESNPNKEDQRLSSTTSSFRKSNRSPQRMTSGIRGRNSHYTGKGNCIESYNYVVSSTFGQGKRSPDQRNLSKEKQATMNSTAQSAFYQTNNLENLQENDNRRNSKQSNNSNKTQKQQYEEPNQQNDQHQQDQFENHHQQDNQHHNHHQQDDHTQDNHEHHHQVNGHQIQSSNHHTHDHNNEHNNQQNYHSIDNQNSGQQEQYHDESEKAYHHQNNNQNHHESSQDQHKDTLDQNVQQQHNDHLEQNQNNHQQHQGHTDSHQIQQD